MIHLTISGYNLYLSAETPKSPDAAGECEPLPNGDYALRISPELNDHVFTEVVIHEILEAIGCVYDLEWSHQSLQTLAVALNQLAPPEFTAMLRRDMKKEEKPAKSGKRSSR